MKRIMIAAMLATGCTRMPTAPSDPMAEWAAAHAHEVCILATWYDNDGHAYISQGVLIPIEKYEPNLMRLMPISYCNPAESTVSEETEEVEAGMRA